MKNILLLAVLVFCTQFAFTQTDTDLEDVFWNAETNFYDENYSEALTQYLEIYNNGYNENSNINYRIGVCYLKGFNSNSDKVKAVPYLEWAVRSTTKDYDEGNFEETDAHEDAFIYLGDAYFVNNELERAIETYEEYKEASQTTDSYYLNIVNRKIETCISARILKTLRVQYETKNIGKPVNDNFANFNASVSEDGNTLVFTSDMKFYTAAMYCDKVDGKFENPKNLNIDLIIEGSTQALSISPDGTEFYVFIGEGEGFKGNIYVSKRVDGKWTELKKLKINSGDLDTDASVSPDGTTLYFASNRSGGFGGVDIYKATKDENGEWSNPVNLGATINSKFDDNSPFLLKDGKTMYFSSQGHENNLGGYDLFMTKLNEDGSWNKPINFGYPVNTTDDEKHIFPLPEAGKGLVSLAEEDSYGDLDVYEITFTPQENPMIQLVGTLDNRGKEIEIISGDKNTKSNTDGEFELIVPSGNIQIEMNAEDMTPAATVINTPEVYCMAQIDLSDINLKHHDPIVTVPDTTATDTITDVADNTDNNNNGTDGTDNTDATDTTDTTDNTDNSDNNDVTDNTDTNNTQVDKTEIETILFGFNKSIPEVYKSNLDMLAIYLNNSSDVLIEVQGYTDLQGDEEYNLYLSKKRASFVKDYLVSKGVDEKKIKVKGFGEANQISSDLGPQTRKYNRRVTFKIIRDAEGKLSVKAPDIPAQYKL